MSAGSPDVPEIDDTFAKRVDELVERYEARIKNQAILIDRQKNRILDLEKQVSALMETRHG